jgi:hypothetical protein
VARSAGGGLCDGAISSSFLAVLRRGTSKPFAPQLAPAALKLSRANFMARTIFRSHSTTSNQWVRKLQYS